MKHFALLLAILATPVMIAGCGKSAVEDDTTKLCTSIEASGLARQCTYSRSFNTVGVIVDSNDDEVGRNVCAAIANRFLPLTSHFSDHWKLQVFSPYRSDKPMATCPLY